MALRGGILNLIWPCSLDDADQDDLRGQIAVMKGGAHVLVVRVSTEMIDTIQPELACTVLNPVDFVAFVKKQLV